MLNPEYVEWLIEQIRREKERDREVLKSIEITGGQYDGREGLIVTRDFEKDRIIVTGWYDGGCELEVEFEMPVAQFCEELGLNPALERKIEMNQTEANQLAALKRSNLELLSRLSALVEWMRYVVPPVGIAPKQHFSADLDAAREAIARAEAGAELDPVGKSRSGKISK